MHHQKNNHTQKTWQIYIQDLELQALIGILPHEKNTKQTVIINIMCLIHTPLETTYVCYDQLIRCIEDFFARGHVDLVEEAAESIAQMCLSISAHIQEIHVRVDKRDVYAHVRRVGVEIARTRKDFPDLFPQQSQ